MGRKTDTPSESTILQAPLLDIPAVATALGDHTSPRAALGRRAEDSVPGRSGGSVRFDPAALNEWLEEQRVEAVRSPLGRYTAGR